MIRRDMVATSQRTSIPRRGLPRLCSVSRRPTHKRSKPNALPRPINSQRHLGSGAPFSGTPFPPTGDVRYLIELGKADGNRWQIVQKKKDHLSWKISRELDISPM